MNSYTDSLTFRLFKRKFNDASLFNAFSILSQDTSDSLYNDSDTHIQADKDSILADWKQVGNDLSDAMNNYEQRNPKAC